MRITHIGNACCTYDHEGFTLLADPWINGPAFGNWVHLHELKTKTEDLLHSDGILITHSHQDHLHADTLKFFRRDIPIMTYKDKFLISERKLKNLGFTNIIALNDYDIHKIGPFEITFLGPFVKHPFHQGDIVGNLVDAAIVIRCDDKMILNANDNTLTEGAAVEFTKTFGNPTVAQLNHNNAGCYPACFMNLTHEQKLSEAMRCVMQNLENMVNVSKALQAKIVQPFAGEFRLSEPYEYLNKYLGTCTGYFAAEYLNLNGVKSVALNEGETIEC